MRSLILLVLVGVALAGCIDNPDSEPAADTGSAFGLAAGETAPVYGAPLLIDDVRAGGEPVIAVMPSGTLIVSTHPGWTHYHPGDDPLATTDLLVPANAQSYLWRSTDGGATWTHVDILPVANVPRSTALGVSDPEFTILDDGTICMTDLIGLASSSVSCSSDDGVTWLPGNSVASGGPNDRQWLASTGNELYFTANYFVDHHIQASNDKGLTWERRGDVPCGLDIVSNPHTDHLIGGCTNGLTVSEDAGFTWDVRGTGMEFGGQRIMTEPAVDAAGNTYMAFTKGERELWVGVTPDEGQTWMAFHNITAEFASWALDNPHGETPNAGSYIWPWISAGSEGRVAVSWIGQYDVTSSSSSSGPWYIFTATLLGAHTEMPAVFVNTLTPEPMHVQPICQSGTTCQVSSVTGDESGDRRLGDFFETTIDAEGFLHASWSNTAAYPEDVISHPQYARQIDGVRLLTEADMGVFMPTQG